MQKYLITQIPDWENIFLSALLVCVLISTRRYK